MTTPLLPILTIAKTGAPFDRYYIEDNQERLWTGSQFEPDGLPVLYATQFAVRSAYHEILKGCFPDVKPVRYLVPVAVEVYSHQPIHISEVAQYLANTASLQMNIPANGNGPRDSLVLARIDWHRIEVQEENSNV